MAKQALLSRLLLTGGAVCSYTAATASDWLVTAPTTPVTLTPWAEGSLSGLELSNGLISRRFATGLGSWATWDFVSHLEDHGDTSLIRALGPESVVTLDGKQWSIGGLRPAANSSQQTAYLNRSAPAVPDREAFRYVRHSTAAPEAPFAWSPGARGSPPDVQWPPPGLHLVVTFEAPEHAPAPVAAMTVEVHCWAPEFGGRVVFRPRPRKRMSSSFLY